MLPGDEQSPAAVWWGRIHRITTLFVVLLLASWCCARLHLWREGLHGVAPHLWNSILYLCWFAHLFTKEKYAEARGIEPASVRGPYAIGLALIFFCSLLWMVVLTL